MKGKYILIAFVAIMLVGIIIVSTDNTRGVKAVKESPITTCNKTKIIEESYSSRQIISECSVSRGTEKILELNGIKEINFSFADCGESIIVDVEKFEGFRFLNSRTYDVNYQISPELFDFHNHTLILKRIELENVLKNVSLSSDMYFVQAYLYKIKRTEVCDE